MSTFSSPSASAIPGTEDLTPWWGEQEVPEGSVARWTVGPYSLWVERTESGYRLAESREDDRRSRRLETRIPADEGPPEDAEVFSVMTSSSDPASDPASGTDGLRLAPCAADRPVVTRPSDACRVLGGAEVTLYVSTPLWIRLETAGGPTLVDAPTVRLSDTWFGPDTRHGELCYSIRTSAVPRRADLPVLAFRAVTRVRVENPAHEDLELQRLALPAPSLSLYHDEARPELGLWTSSVAVRLSPDGETAEVDVHRQPPRDLDSPRRVAEPRERASRNVLARAMSSILR